MSLPHDKYFILRKVFGCSGFRPGQEQVIDSILSGRDTIAVLPTGGGKSFCYQIPALLLPGVTIVISPLISLMNDQVAALLRRGVRAACLSSEMSAWRRKQVLSQAARGEVKLLYLAPERLFSPSFLRLFRDGTNSAEPPERAAPEARFPGDRSAGRLPEVSPRLAVSMICVDEAHCVSQWGREFRPAYLRIREFVRFLRDAGQNPVISAFTATAAPRVRRDILHLTGLRRPFVLITGFDRPNLYYGLICPEDKYLTLKHLVRKYDGACGIVYCRTRATAEAVADRLAADGIPSVCYHAGMPAQRKAESQERFLSGSSRLIVATSAFGMGIDKPDVRFVIHYNMPGDVESYYQEAGRAGRDGKPADCVLMADHRDVVINRFFISRAEDPNLRSLLRENLFAMRRLASGRVCMRHFILEYFGESSPRKCGHCSFCLGRNRLRPATPEGIPDPELLSDLTGLRLRVAGERKLLPYRVFPDRVLRDFAARRPARYADMLSIEGVSPVSVIKYGADFLREIRAWKTCI